MILLTMEYKKGIKNCDGCIHLEKIKKSAKWSKHPKLPKCDKYTAMRDQIRCIDYILDLS